MNPDVIIVRLGELMLKGRNRQRFVRQIADQLKRHLVPYPAIRMSDEFGRFYLELNGESYTHVTQGLELIFGIHSFIPAYVSALDVPLLEQTAVRIVERLAPKPQTFKVTVRRVNRDVPYDTPALNRLLGGAVLQRISGLNVDVHTPECELKVEVRADRALLFVHSQTVPGAGGFPKGTNGKAMLLLSGGIDSPVAGWLAMRKGLALEAVHFHSYPYTSERAKQKVIDLTRRLSVFGGPLKLHLVPFTSIQTKLVEAGQDNLLITLMRRAMLRITEQLAVNAGGLGIVTGESLGQVASQTLSSLHTIGQAATLPLLRPLITVDKDEVIKLAERIGTYAISILPFEDCCTLFQPKSPSTNPNSHVVERMEGRMGWLPEELARAVEQTETVRIGPDDDKLDDYF